jgi:lipopolysaccharide export system permease protein
LSELKSNCEKYLNENKNRWLNYLTFWKQGGIDNNAKNISDEIENVVKKLENSDQNLVLNKTMDLPVIKNYQLANFNIIPKIGIFLEIFFPIGIIIYMIAIYRRKLLKQDIRSTTKVCDEIKEMIK